MAHLLMKYKTIIIYLLSKLFVIFRLHKVKA